MGDKVETNYEYSAINAPTKYFIDFSNLDKQEDDQKHLEDYFNFDHEKGVPVNIDESPSEQKSQRKSTMIQTDTGDGLKEETEVLEEQVVETKVSSNIRSKSNNRSHKRAGSMESRYRHNRTGSMETRPTLKRKGSLRDCSKSETTTSECPRAIAGKTVMSSEQQEMMKMQELRQALAKKRKLAEKSCQKALKCQPLKPIRSEVQVTKPEEFHFATDTRIKNPQNDTKPEHPKSPALQKKLKRTVPKPFNLTESKRKKEGHDDNQFVPMAVTVNQFSKSTPIRFRTRANNKPPSPIKNVNVKGTIPQTPNFQTNTRHRSTHVISSVEREELEVQEMCKNQFKARPMNKKVFDGIQGLKKVHAKPATEIVPFDLETNRPRTRSHTRQESKEREFHAQPFPQNIFKKPTGLKKVEPVAPTNPESPAFALKNRVRKHQTPTEEEPVKKMPRVQPVPHHGLPFLPKIDHRTTEIQPFSFAERDHKRLAKKEEKLRQLRENEGKVGDIRVGEFHARPVPDPSPDHLPEKRVKPATRPEPFQLEIDMRGTIRSEQWSQKVEEALKQQKDAMKFKAQPSKVIHEAPFKPKKNEKVLAEVHNFELNTDKRAKERDAWEMHRKAKEAELDEQNRQKQKEDEERQQHEMKKLRKEVVHKAASVRHYKTVVILPSDRPPTEAETPKFSERLRTRSRRN